MKTKKTLQFKIIKPNNNKKLKINTTMRQYRKCVNFYLHQIAKGEPINEIYRQAKENYNLPTGLIQTARDIAKEQYNSYKDNEENSKFPHFYGFVPMRMDKRTINFSEEDNHFKWWANISTVGGKVKVPITGRNLDKLKGDFKSVQAIFKNNSFYLNVIFEEEHKIPKQEEFEYFIGVDLGLNNIATVVVQNRYGEILETEFFSGKQLMQKRSIIKELKAKLQEKRCWNKLREIKNKEGNYMKDVNHKISSKIKEIAKKYDNCCIVMEKLKGIRNKVKYSKEFNRNFYKWSFAELQSLIKYKAHEVNTAVRKVYPNYTSQVCRDCLGKVKRSSQNISKAVCEICKKEYNADFLGAVNVVRKFWGYMSQDLGFSGSSPKQSIEEDEGVTASTFGKSKGMVAQLNPR